MGSEYCLPVYDLNDLDEGKIEVTDFRECLKKVGAFRITNHSIPDSVLEGTSLVCKEVFGMPEEKKCQYAASHQNAFIRTQYGIVSHESFSIPQDLGISTFFNIMCPDSGVASREIMEEYVHKMDEISQTIMRVLLRTFGVEEYYETIFRRYHYRTRLNYFPEVKEETEEFVALNEHTDAGILTILKLDNTVGMFQVFKEDWVNVAAMPSCIIILLGDIFRAWSNGRTHSAKHRVIAKGPQQPRLTIGFFCHFPADTEVYAPEALVDAENPRHHKPFYYADFSKAKFGPGLQQAGPVIDTFAAID